MKRNHQDIMREWDKITLKMNPLEREFDHLSESLKNNPNFYNDEETKNQLLRLTQIQIQLRELLKEFSDRFAIEIPDM